MYILALETTCDETAAAIVSGRLEVAASVVAEDLGVREAQDWWRHQPLEAGLEMLKRRGIEIARQIA